MGWSKLIVVALVLGLGQAKEICELCSCSAVKDTLKIDCAGKFLPEENAWPSQEQWLTVFSQKMTDDLTKIDLDLSRNGIKDLEPDLFPEFPVPVNHLSLSENNMVRMEPGSLANLTGLRCLDLGQNELTKLRHVGENNDEKERFFDVFWLRHAQTNPDGSPLDDNNEVEEDHVIHSLKVLNLAGNRLANLDEDFFEPIPELEFLSFDGNPMNEISVSTLTALKSLKNLTSLNLANSALTSLPDEFNLENLKSLNLSGNMFKTVPPQLKDLKNLEELSINYNSKIRNLTSASFEGMGHLKILHASHMSGLERVEERAFSPLTSLDELFLQENAYLGFISPDAFEGVNGSDFKLRILFLSGNDLTYLDINTLPDTQYWWNNLTMLNLERNPWACDCHNSWIFHFLLPVLEAKVPNGTLGLNMRCGGPGDLKGVKMHELELRPDEIPCEKLDHFNPRKPGFGVDPDRYKTYRRHYVTSYDEQKHTNGMATGVIVVCLLVVLGSALFVGGMYLRRQRQMRYRTFENPDFDHNLSDFSPSDFDNVPSTRPGRH